MGRLGTESGEREKKNWEIYPQLHQAIVQASAIVKPIPSTSIVSLFWFFTFIFTLFLFFNLGSNLI